VTFDPLAAPPAHAELARLRERCPVTRNPGGTWYLADYDDVLAATQDVHTFRASFRAPGVVVPPEEQFVNEIPEPRHGHVRKIINSAIASHRLTRVEPFCRDLCGRLLDDIKTRTGERPGPVELVSEFVMPVPNTVIAFLLGAEPSDYARWAQWSDDVVTGTLPATNRTERGEGLAGGHPEFAAYVDALIADRRANPRDDFVTRLVTREVDGRPLTDVEARAQLVFLFISGNETTRHLLGNLLYRLAADPALLGRLRADPALIPAAVEESLRLDPPVRFLLRECTTDADVRGEEMRAGDTVAFGLESANRDAERFAEPDSFVLNRPDNRRHLAFGGGPHICPGAHLARLEGRVALEVFLERVAACRLAEGEAYDDVPVMWAHGPSRLPVELTWSTSA
jgi:cytochrome P450